MLEIPNLERVLGMVPPVAAFFVTGKYPGDILLIDLLTAAILSSELNSSNSLSVYSLPDASASGAIL